MSYKPVDTAIVMTVGPCIDDTDFKSLEEAIAYDAAGMDISLIVEKTDGTTTVTAITLTTGGTSDWTHKDGGYYEVEITAAQNAEEGIAYLRGVCTGVLPFESPRYDIVTANIYDSWIKGTDNLQVDITHILGHLLTQTGTQLADGFEKFFDVGTPTGTVNSLPDAAPDAAGGLPKSDAGGLDLDAKLANTNEVTAARMGALTDWIDGGRLDLLLDAIPTTAMRGTDGANTVVPDAAGTAATPAEVATALVDIHLDHLLAADYDPASKPGVATALLNELVENDGGVSRYTANALEQAPSGGTNPNVLVDTTIATLATQTSFTLTAGSSDDDAYKDQAIVLYDASSSDFPSVRVCSAYTGATKTVTLDSAPDFTATVGDGTKVFVTAPGTSAPTAAQNADAVWDELKADHVIADSFGDYLDDEITSRNAVTPPTVTQIRTEMDTNSIRLDADISSRAPASEYDEQFEDLRVLVGDGGDVYYVSTAGDNTDGTTWAKAKTTIDAAIALCTANHSDKIYIAHGTYDETANGATGVAVDVAGIKIVGVGLPTIKNTDTTANGSVITVTATNTIVENVFVEKGETTSDGAIAIHVNGSYVVCDIRGVMVAVEKDTHTGIKFNGGAISCSYMDTCKHLAHIYSLSGLGVGIEFADCSGCIVIAPHLHDLTTGIYFSGGAACDFNVVSPDTMILNCDTGIKLDAGASSNALSANIVNCTEHYDDNSGNTTNKADASLTYVLDDIKTHVQDGFSEVQGSGFVEATDSLEAIRVELDGLQGTDGKMLISTDAQDLSASLIVDAEDSVCDAILTGASHNIATSLGRRIRELGAYHISSGTAQAGTAYGVTLAAGESATDHLFDRNLLVILAGTGAGQTRTIVDYDGVSKVAVIDRNWWINPDATSEYSIIPDDTPLVADHGVAQAGSDSTITLRTAASAIDSTYSDLIIFIMAGTGAGQARLIDAYVGGTKVATIHGTWTTNPDNTSVYCMIASGLGHTVGFTAEALAKIKSEADDALTDYDPPTRTEATSDKDAIIAEVNENEAKIDTMQGNVTDILTDTNVTIPGTITTLQTDSTAIKAKTDSLPSGITKNVALSDFNFYMVLSSDHVTEATGKTVVGTISKDGGAFAALTNSITEIASGMYKVDLTQAEMNADVVSLKFTETDCDQRIITIYTS